MKAVRGRGRLIDASVGLIVGQSSIFLGPMIIGAEVRGWRLSAAQAGELQSLELLTLAVAGILAARFVHRRRWSKMYLAGALVVIVGNLLSGWVPTVWQLVLARMLAAMGGGAVVAVSTAMLASAERPEKETNRALASQSLGFAILLCVLPWSLSTFGQEGFFSAIAAILAALLLWRGPRLSTGSNGETVSPPVSRPPLAKVVLLLFGSMTGLWLIVGGVYNYSEQAGLHVGLSEQTTGAVLSGANIAGMLGCAVASILGPRWKVEGLLLGSAVFTVASGAITLGTSISELYIPALLVFGAANMLALTYALAVAARLDEHGRVAAGLMGYLAFPFAFGPIAVGWLTTDIALLAKIIAAIGTSAILVLIYLLSTWQRRRMPLGIIGSSPD
jgi:MFS family permease